jgi:hypothetical protein
MGQVAVEVTAGTGSNRGVRHFERGAYGEHSRVAGRELSCLDGIERVPAGQLWYPSGHFCGTEEDNRWITALEIKMLLIEGWRSA